MTAWVVLATCGPAAALSVTWIVAISRGKATPTRQYTPPPITDEYVQAAFAIIRRNYHKESTP